MLLVIVPLWALLAVTEQSPSVESCMCEWTNSERPFPFDQLNTVEATASKCNSEMPLKKSQALEAMLSGLERRLLQLLEDVSKLEKEKDEGLYGVLSLQVIENEMKDINQLTDNLNSTTQGHRRLTLETSQQVREMKAVMEQLETYDKLHVVKTESSNTRLRRDLENCRNEIHPEVQPTHPYQGHCPHGVFTNISGPRVTTAGEYPGSYKYGAWGQDPKPEVGKESWYWLVMLTSSNAFGHYVRLYSSLSSLIVGVSTPGNVMIHTTNPTTNTIQGPNVVLYNGALYYNCYNKGAVCRFNMTSKTISILQLPQGTRFNSKANFCYLDECYPYTDLDLATDESGVWVVYTTTQDLGNLVLAKLDEGEEPTIRQTWHTSLYKLGVTNTFMTCGVLYATRFVDKDREEIFYSFDTATGIEEFNLGIFLKKMAPNLNSLNYSPVDQMLHAYCNSQMVSYKVLFE